jgi:hypothetical protein
VRFGIEHQPYLYKGDTVTRISITQNDAVALFHFDCSQDRPILVRSQPDSGKILTEVCGALIGKNILPGVTNIYSDYLMNVRGFMSTYGLQRRLPWGETGHDDSILTLRRAAVRVSALSLEEPEIASDTGSYFPTHEPPGLVASPLIAIALSQSIAVTVVTYTREQRIDGGNYSSLRRALREDITGINDTERPLIPPRLLERSLNQILSARPILSHGRLHVAAWQRCS